MTQQSVQFIDSSSRTLLPPNTMLHVPARGLTSGGVEAQTGILAFKGHVVWWQEDGGWLHEAVCAGLVPGQGAIGLSGKGVRDELKRCGALGGGPRMCHSRLCCSDVCVSPWASGSRAAPVPDLGQGLRFCIPSKLPGEADVLFSTCRPGVSDKSIIVIPKVLA